MNNINSAETRSHTIHLNNRSELDINGIDDVISFDEQSIVLQTCQGILTVDGEELHIVKLNVDKGETSVEGRISGIFYMENSDKASGGKKRKGLFG